MNYLAGSANAHTQKKTVQKTALLASNRRLPVGQQKEEALCPLGFCGVFSFHFTRVVPMRPGKTSQIQKRRVIGLWIFIMAIFITELLVYTWSRLQCVQTGYEISNAAHKRKELIAIQKNLKIELARLKSPKRISKIARERLGMAPPSPEQIISIP